MGKKEREVLNYIYEFCKHQMAHTSDYSSRSPEEDDFDSSVIGANYAHDFTAVIEKNYRMLKRHGLQADKPIGVGGYGCVFAYKDPIYVAKVTDDESEMELAELLLRNPLPAFPHIHQVMHLDLPDDLTYTHAGGYALIVRENCTPIDKSKRKDNAKMVEKLSALTKFYTESMTRGQPKPSTMFKAIETMYPKLSHIGRSFRTLYEEMYFLEDLETRNAGYSKQNNRVVFFDAQLALVKRKSAQRKYLKETYGR